MCSLPLPLLRTLSVNLVLARFPEMATVCAGISGPLEPVIEVDNTFHVPSQPRILSGHLVHPPSSDSDPLADGLFKKWPQQSLAHVLFLQQVFPSGN